MELAGKTVLITGGSRGMGQRLAVRLGRERANVVVNFKKDAEAAKAPSEEVIAAGGDAVAVQADIAEPEAVGALVQTAADRFGAIDVVVANAAASAFKPLSEIHARHVDKTMAITVEGFLELVRASTPHMPRGGRIVAVSGWDSFRSCLAMACSARRRRRWRRWSSTWPSNSGPIGDQLGRHLPRARSTPIRSGITQGTNGIGMSATGWR